MRRHSSEVCVTYSLKKSDNADLEAARIGSQLFAFDSATSDQMATPRLFDTYATRLSAQALRRLEWGKEKGRSPVGPRPNNCLFYFRRFLRAFSALSTPLFEPLVSL